MCILSKEIKDTLFKEIKNLTIYKTEDEFKAPYKLFQERFNCLILESWDDIDLIERFAGKDEKSLYQNLNRQHIGRINLSINKFIELCRNFDTCKNVQTQLIAGCKVLNSASLEISKQNYKQIEKDMISAVPDFYRYLWAHKYFEQIYPNILCGVHKLEHQKYFLEKVIGLENYDKTDTQYYLAYYFHKIAKEEFDIPIYLLVAALYKCYRPQKI